MQTLLHHIISSAAERHGARDALVDKNNVLTYSQLDELVSLFALGISQRGVNTGNRVAIYLPKSIEAVIAMFATSAAGGVFVPVNPKLKGNQVKHIVHDCGAKLLITDKQRLSALESQYLEGVKTIAVVDFDADVKNKYPNAIAWSDLSVKPSCNVDERPTMLETDIAALFYTSGSTGLPKGVVLTHRNMLLGAASVAEYLEHSESDRVLAALPFSFDYGFSQLSVSFYTGACCVLLDYLFPRDITNAVQRFQITGLALVPPIWMQLIDIEDAKQKLSSLRYFCNSGGALPEFVTLKLLELLPHSKPFLMYGLTEAFRSCYLAPEKARDKPNSFGQEIPNARVYLVNDKNALCAVGEVGELVHVGPLVSGGYWNQPELSGQRFRELPPDIALAHGNQPAVWSGDLVKADAEGDLYFVGRVDEQIKCMGYRVSPVEVEQLIYLSELVHDVMVFGAADAMKGQAIAAVVCLNASATLSQLQQYCRQQLTSYQTPSYWFTELALPLNKNGKLDRSAIKSTYLKRIEQAKDE